MAARRDDLEKEKEKNDQNIILMKKNRINDFALHGVPIENLHFIDECFLNSSLPNSSRIFWSIMLGSV